MSCIPIKNGVVCIGNEPVQIKHEGKAYRFEWTAASGWMPLNQDDTQRLTPVPAAVWDKIQKVKP